MKPSRRLEPRRPVVSLLCAALLLPLAAQDDAGDPIPAEVQHEIDEAARSLRSEIIRAATALLEEFDVQIELACNRPYGIEDAVSHAAKLYEQRRRFCVEGIPPDVSAMKSAAGDYKALRKEADDVFIGSVDEVVRQQISSNTDTTIASRLLEQRNTLLMEWPAEVMGLDRKLTDGLILEVLRRDPLPEEFPLAVATAATPARTAADAIRRARQAHDQAFIAARHTIIQEYALLRESIVASVKNTDDLVAESAAINEERNRFELTGFLEDDTRLNRKVVSVFNDDLTAADVRLGAALDAIAGELIDKSYVVSKAVLARRDELLDRSLALPLNVVPRSKEERKALYVDGAWRADVDLITQSDSTGSDRVLVFGPSTYSDYDFSAEIMRTDGGSAVGLLVYVQSDDTYRKFMVGDQQNRRFTLSSVKDGVPVDADSANAPKGSIENDRWYTLRIEVRGPTAVGYLDDVKIVLGEDADFVEGRIGLVTHGSVATFGNVRMTDVDGRTIWKGGPYICEFGPDDPLRVDSTWRGSRLIVGDEAKYPLSLHIEDRRNDEIRGTLILGKSKTGVRFTGTFDGETFYFETEREEGPFHQKYYGSVRDAVLQLNWSGVSSQGDQQSGTAHLERSL